MSEHAKSQRQPASVPAAAARIQRKMQVSEPGDTLEREADDVAARVLAGQPAAAVSRMAAPEKKGPAAQRAAAAPEKKEPAVQRAAATPEKKEPPIQRAAAAPEKKEPAVQRAAAAPEKKEPAAQRIATGPSSVSLGDAAQRAVDSKGQGRPMEPSVRQPIERSLGADLGHVRVHDDAASRASAAELNAKAFTHGSDIWMGPGESSSDLRLMGHEATHVVQQGGAAQQRVQRTNGSGTSGTAPVDPAAALEDLKTFRLPPIKARHRGVYETWAGRGALKRMAGYTRGEPNQKDGKWLPNVNILPARLEALHLPPSFTGRKTIRLASGRNVSGTYRQLMDRLKVPNWDRAGGMYPFPFEVDHIVELQTGSWGSGEGSSTEANELPNMELLDKSSNASAGSRTRLSIRENVSNYLRATIGRNPGGDEISAYLRANTVAFNRVVLGTEGSAAGSQWWSKDEIEAGAHLEGAFPVQNTGEAGTATAYALVTPEGGVLGAFPHAEGASTIAVEDGPAQQRVQGLRILSINLGANAATATRDAQIGTVTARLDPPDALPDMVVPMNIPLHSAGQYAGYLGELPGIGEGDLPGASPIRFERPTIEDDGLVIAGQLTPTLPLLGETPIDVRITGRELAFVYYFSVGEITLPLPGVSIDDVTLGISFGTAGFRAEGTVFFGVERLGSGSLTAGVDGSGNFEAGGSFDFDSELFDEARIEVWYRERAFGGRGTLRITQPNKVRGIRSLEASATFAENSVQASGSVVPDIPGVENATLAIDYSEAEGLRIHGTAAFGRDVPGINSGSLEVEVRKPAGESQYLVFAHGTAVPATPGINTTLDAVYENGAINISGHTDYSRGMLSGGIDIGVTNREFDAAGEPTEEVGSQLRVYGGGSVTIRIAPWLQGTVGVHLLPNGEIELSGEIALPDQIEIFDRKQIDKSLLNIAIQVPIFPGIVAEIGGGLSAQAGIGPGVIDQLRLGITYNPSHEENTHVTGDAHLNIPADAGLRLAVRAGIGLGITGASATGGLEIGGLLGLAGAAEAGVHIDWMPSTGLVIDAFGELHAEPVFRFDISGYVSVRALGFEVYGNTWEFASYEFGSNMRFGVRFPIHYVEGQPFDISLDDVEFIVPEVNPRDVLSGLIDRIA